MCNVLASEALDTLNSFNDEKYLKVINPNRIMLNILHIHYIQVIFWKHA